jgi:hypothetical protein
MEQASEFSFVPFFAPNPKGLADSASCQAEGLVAIDAIFSRGFPILSWRIDSYTHRGFLSISQGAFQYNKDDIPPPGRISKR